MIRITYKFWVLIIISAIGIIESILHNDVMGYFEYKYYCTIESNNRITVSLKPNTEQGQLCLSYLSILDTNISTYTQQIRSAQDNIITQPHFNEYRNTYLDEIQPKLLQSRILHTQITQSMAKFESNLFNKTMIYISYHYKPVLNNLKRTLERRQNALNKAIQEGDSNAVLRINKKYETDIRKFEIINLMLKAKNFNEFMPFYTMLKKGKFEL